MQQTPELTQHDPQGDWSWSMGWGENTYGSGGTLDECLAAVFNAIEANTLTPDEFEILSEAVRSQQQQEIRGRLTQHVAQVRSQLLRTGVASGEGWSIYVDLEEAIAA